MKYLLATLFLLLSLFVTSSVLADGPLGLFGGNDDIVDSESQSLKYKEASFYGQRAEQRGIEVGIIRFEKKEQERILGKKVSKYLTYDVAITNGSPFRIHLSTVEILNPKSKAVIPNANLDEVYDKMGVVGNGNKDNLRSSIMRYNFLNKSLQNKIIEPGDTLQGILFIKDKNIDGRGILKVTIQNLKKLAYLDVEVPFEE